ncbi:hypothetical protein ABTW96_24520 [Nocardia beijingensis]|uniref:hypothetical protein n=1 Tax=Nocardia beijingensis TaxID=95162 RepID=UPI00332A080E
MTLTPKTSRITCSVSACSGGPRRDLPGGQDYQFVAAAGGQADVVKDGECADTGMGHERMAFMMNP